MKKKSQNIPGFLKFILWVPRDQTRVSGKRYLTGPKLASLEDTH